ncbi:hypothetical protein [Clostridium lundense]|uniref:hypothetical protein n=1 Tax=Clostridium lundense TaxID=319475 RepID=UPI000487C37D|nr:hypothetical protein [Clostridium lundense]
MFKSLFGKDEEFDGVEKGEFHDELDQGENIARRALMRIIDIQIVYNTDDGVCYTMATCINEHNRIETINIEGFKIDSNVSNMVGAQVEYETYDEYDPDEEYGRGRIFLSDDYPL